ncbi:MULTISPECIES: DNA repair protein RecO [Lysinibacillus]|uniref:DNA repair protein RecO n=1 Tax=Lysinibacillus antri TaxID=2498145 RepID=A0A432LGG6_9BACI|nr:MULTISPECIES: DNA repair protein RecO [Lysinibacillus]RUL57039.1 DNA repair protein RecO [Lysinibacillus antri]TSI03328.1 DNA repair protein RecO [Lysinibacillus sp. BW-2-10]
MLNKWEGIVLKSRAYGESNKIVTLLTREAGKVAVMARGAKKPTSRLAGVTQTFMHGMFIVQRSSGMGTLQQGEHISSMRHIQTDILTTAYASYMVELVDRLVEEGGPQPFAFEVLLQAMNALEEEYDPEAIVLFVDWKMLPFAGVQPILHKCAACGQVEGEFAFSFTQGGFICHRCFHVDPYIIRLSPKQLKLIRMFYSVPIDQVGKLELKRETKQFIKKIVTTIYEEQTGIRLKSRTFIEQLERTPLLIRKQNEE